MEEIVQLISNLGFPIAACIAMYHMVNTQLKENTTAINNNTKLMEKILSKLSLRGEDDGE